MTYFEETPPRLLWAQARGSLLFGYEVLLRQEAYGTFNLDDEEDEVSDTMKCIVSCAIRVPDLCL